MKSAKMLTNLVLTLIMMVCFSEVCKAVPMGTAWTYQGRLMDGNNPAGGPYDFEFRLFDDPCTGTQQGSTIDFNDLDVVDGHFTVELDFGSDVFNGDARWLETTVSQANGSDPCTLRPRIEVTPVPYALQTRGIFVDDSGNVGIGTTSPEGRLYVDGGTSAVSDVDATDIVLKAQDASPASFGPAQGGDIILLPGQGWFLEGNPLGHGSVCIGTTSTNSYSKLHIHEPEYYWVACLLRITTEWSGSSWMDGLEIGYTQREGDARIWNNENTSMNFGTNDTSRMVISKSGDVGIGTTDPRAGLHINRAGDWGSLAISNKNINITYGETHFDYPDSKNYIRGTTIIADTGGNVGVGTTNPVQKLDVQGTIRMSSANGAEIDISSEPGYNQIYSYGGDHLVLDTSGNVGIGITNPYADLHVRNGYSGEIPVNVGGLFVENGGVADNSFVFQTATAGGGKSFSVTNAGNVGIGTTSPAGKLDVNGSIYQRGSSLHADYVFEPGYESESIDEHSEYMWRQKHLPAIPKAKLDENGREILEVGAHRRGIIEELEKAHIYIEQLHKRINTLEETNKEISTLQKQIKDLQEQVAQLKNPVK